MQTPPDLVVLESLRWTRLRCAVRNLRRGRASEHPLWILHSLLMYAVPPAAKDGSSRFLFRPLTPVGEETERNLTYQLDVFFPGDDLGLPRACADGMARHLSDPRNNFALENVENPQLRTLADLVDAAAPWPPDTTEICLEFQTPIAFTPADRRCPWRLDGPQLGRLFAHRLQHFFVLPAPPLPATWNALTPSATSGSSRNYGTRPKAVRG